MLSNFYKLQEARDRGCPLQSAKLAILLGLRQVQGTQIERFSFKCERAAKNERSQSYESIGMLALETQSHLRVIHHQGTIGEVSPSIIVGKFAAENQATLEDLERKRDLLWAIWNVCASSLAIGTLVKPALLLVLPILKRLTGQLQGTAQRLGVMSDLVNALEDEDIQITVGLQPEGLREIDFFLGFPDKEFILIQIRSLGDVEVFFSEQHDALRFRKKGKSVKTWKPDPLMEIIEQERWLRKERPDLLGGSSRDKRRPISKLLVLANVTKVGANLEHLYAILEGNKYLTIRKSGTTSIVEKNQVVDFIRDYLKSRRSTKTLNN